MIGSWREDAKRANRNGGSIVSPLVVVQGDEGCETETRWLKVEGRETTSGLTSYIYHRLDTPRSSQPQLHLATMSIASKYASLPDIVRSNHPPSSLSTTRPSLSLTASLPPLLKQDSAPDVYETPDVPPLTSGDVCTLPPSPCYPP